MSKAQSFIQTLTVNCGAQLQIIVCFAADWLSALTY